MTLFRLISTTGNCYYTKIFCALSSWPGALCDRDYSNTRVYPSQLPPTDQPEWSSCQCLIHRGVCQSDTWGSCCGNYQQHSSGQNQTKAGGGPFKAQTWHSIYNNGMPFKCCFLNLIETIPSQNIYSLFFLHLFL